MLALIRVGGWSKSPPRGAVIFVHGLGGHPYKTWAHNKIPEDFWPAWLIEDIPSLSAYTVQYPAALSRFLGAGLSIYDRAKTILEELLVEEELNNQPLIFVCHSMGGLIVKQLLQEADRRAEDQRDQACRRLVFQTKAVAFIATPHLGSAQANWLTRLGFLVWPSEATQDLVANDPSLRQLHEWYIQWPRSKQIRHLEIQETRDTFGFRIVAPTVPGLNTTSIPIDANHVSVCKPATKQTPPYRQVRKFLREVLEKDAGAEGQIAKGGAPSLDKVQFLSRDRAFLLPRLARVAAALLLAFIVVVATTQSIGHLVSLISTYIGFPQTGWSLQNCATEAEDALRKFRDDHSSTLGAKELIECRNPIGHAIVGSEAFYRGAYSNAELSFAEAISRLPKNEKSNRHTLWRVDLASAQIENGDYRSAISTFSELVQQHPTADEFKWDLAKAYLYQGQKDPSAYGLAIDTLATINSDYAGRISVGRVQILRAAAYVGQSQQQDMAQHSREAAKKRAEVSLCEGIGKNQQFWTAILSKKSPYPNASFKEELRLLSTLDLRCAPSMPQ